MTSHALMALLLPLSGTAAPFNKAAADSSEQVIFYNSYGYLSGDHWLIPMRIHVMEQRNYLERPVKSLVRRLWDLNHEQTRIFQSIMHDFLSDSESREVVSFRFEGDPEVHDYFLLDPLGGRLRTDTNGNKAGELRIPISLADSLLDAQQSKEGWLTLMQHPKGTPVPEGFA